MKDSAPQNFSTKNLQMVVREGIPARKSSASCTDLNSGTWLGSSTNRGAGTMPCLEWRYGAKILLAVATTLASWFVVMISESATRGSLLSLLDRGFFAFACSGFLVDAPWI